jgi:tetratricopeptide (TPR) repeat protein
MLRKRLIGVCVLACSFVLGGITVSSKAQAQSGVMDLDADKPKASKTKSGGKGGKKNVDIDLDEQASAQQGPVSAGAPSEAFGRAKKLFDKEKWSDAATGMYQVVSGASGDDEGNKQMSQYYLAICLYRLKFYQASYSIFSVIADNKFHLKFGETLLWLAKLATQLPEPADIIERVGKYSDEEVARFDNAQQQELYWTLNYMLGRFKYRNRQYEESIRLFQRVDRRSEHYVQAQFFTGVSYVQKRQSIPAVKSFQRIEKALEEGVSGVEEEGRMRDLAYLSMARTYYSASVRLNAETNVPTIDGTKLSAAVKYWNQIDVASEYWLDALFEESWAYFMAGDYTRALGNIHTIQSPYFPNSFYPEADILKAVIYFANCNYEAAMIVVARFNKRFVPIKAELDKILNRYKGSTNDEAFFKFLIKVREHNANLDPTIEPIVSSAMGDRQLLRNIEYVRLLDEEKGRFKKSPSNFQDSGIGGQVRESLALASEMAVRQTGELAMSRYRRFVEDIHEQVRNGEKILIDITAAQRNLLDEKLKKGQVTTTESKIYGIVNPDQEHILWPFDGEYWRDELGFYRQVIMSTCGR